jgi:hypothetical protein
MPHADTLTVIHHDDTRTEYTNVAYQLHRDGLCVWTAAGQQHHSDVLMAQAYRRRASEPSGPGERDDHR